MADHKLKGILGAGDKSPNHGSSGSQSPLQKRIADLESMVQRLQKQIAINDDPMATKTFMEGEGDESFDEGTVPPSQVRNYLRRKKPKDKHSREYDYGGRYEDRYRDDDYYEKVIMMKVLDSIQNLIFRNLKEECMLMTSWIGLIPSNVSLNIMIPPSGKR